MKIHTQAIHMAQGLLGQPHWFDENSHKENSRSALVTLEELQTVIVEIEAVLNDRPITFVPSDINEAEPSTPSHLLYGRITSLPFHTPISPDELTNPDYRTESDVQRRVKLQAIIL